jgi:hypothetical protein
MISVENFIKGYFKLFSSEKKAFEEWIGNGQEDLQRYFVGLMKFRQGDIIGADQVWRSMNYVSSANISSENYLSISEFFLNIQQKNYTPTLFKVEQKQQSSELFNSQRDARGLLCGYRAIEQAGEQGNETRKKAISFLDPKVQIIAGMNDEIKIDEEATAIDPERYCLALENTVENLLNDLWEAIKKNLKKDDSSLVCKLMFRMSEEDFIEQEGTKKLSEKAIRKIFGKAENELIQEMGQQTWNERKKELIHELGEKELAKKFEQLGSREEIQKQAQQRIDKCIETCSAEYRDKIKTDLLSAHDPQVLDQLSGDFDIFCHQPLITALLLDLQSVTVEIDRIQKKIQQEVLSSQVAKPNPDEDHPESKSNYLGL